MEKIVLKYEADDAGNNDTITMEFSSEEMTIWELADRLQQFCIAIGYSPTMLNTVFKDYN